MSSSAHEASGDGEDAQSLAFRFVAGGEAAQGQALGPGKQVGGQSGSPAEPILGQVVEG